MTCTFLNLGVSTCFPRPNPTSLMLSELSHLTLSVLRHFPPLLFTFSRVQASRPLSPPALSPFTLRVPLHRSVPQDGDDFVILVDARNPCFSNTHTFLSRKLIELSKHFFSAPPPRTILEVELDVDSTLDRDFSILFVSPLYFSETRIFAVN